MQAELFSSRLAPASASKPQIVLSLMQPWPWAIFEAGKRLENRSQKGGGLPLVCRHRGPLWLVARAAVPRGCIVGRCVVVGHVSAQRVPKTASNGAARIEMWKHFEGPHITHARAKELHRWWLGRRGSLAWERQQRLWWGKGYALIFADVHKLRTPIPCKGSQGLWRVQDDVAQQLEGAELIPCAA